MFLSPVSIDPTVLAWNAAIIAVYGLAAPAIVFIASQCWNSLYLSPGPWVALCFCKFAKFPVLHRTSYECR
jgi:hypothetical protein